MKVRGSELILAIRYFGSPEIPTTSGWHGLLAELDTLGMQVANRDNYVSATHLLVIDYVRKDEARWPTVPKANRYLVATEPVSVNPIEFSKRITDKFNRVIVPSKSSPRNRNTVVYEGGYINRNRYRKAYPNTGQREGCGLINENKFSFARESNYGLRTRLIERALMEDFDLMIAGRNWSRGPIWTIAKLVHHALIGLKAKRFCPRFKDLVAILRFPMRRKRIKKIYQGSVPDNVEFLSNFKVAIVIENESSYVSEKLHAALVAGCQCVYVGPSLNPNDFPAGFLFQANPDPGAILEAARTALSSTYEASAESLLNHIQTSPLFERIGVERRNAWVAQALVSWARNAPNMAGE